MRCYSWTTHTQTQGLATYYFPEVYHSRVLPVLSLHLSLYPFISVSHTQSHKMSTVSISGLSKHHKLFILLQHIKRRNEVGAITRCCSKTTFSRRTEREISSSSSYHEKFLFREVQNKAMQLGGQEIDAKGTNSQQRERESQSVMQTQSEVLV